VRNELSNTGIGLVTAGFSPPEAMSALAGYLALPGPVLSDEQRVLYQLLGIGRAPLWRVYSPGTVAFYLVAALRGRRLSAPVEDTRQLGGDALVVDGVITRRWAPRTPGDRASPKRLAVAALRADMR
jgi:hypothetical protein